jgi:hypothetical protein
MQPSEFMATNFDDLLELHERIEKARSGELDFIQQIAMAIVRSNQRR